MPDVYEVGMSNLGLKILYEVLNRREDTAAERVYAPWVDMEAAMRERHLPLFSLETFTEIKRFDFLGFSLPRPRGCPVPGGARPARDHLGPRRHPLGGLQHPLDGLGHRLCC